jgi:hypothetical protein
VVELVLQHFDHAVSFSDGAQSLGLINEKGSIPATHHGLYRTKRQCVVAKERTQYEEGNRAEGFLRSPRLLDGHLVDLLDR